MSLPNYIVNLEELVDAVAGNYKTTELLKSGKQGAKGLRIERLDSNINEISWIAPHDLLVTGIGFTIDECRNIGYANGWSMYVNGADIMNNIRVKEMQEYKPFRNYYPVFKNQEIKFVFNNRDNIDKSILFDIDYIETDIPMIEIVVKCIDETNGGLLGRYNSFYYPPQSVTIAAPNIDGYELVSDSEITTIIDINSKSPTEIIFYYKPAAKTVIVKCINQDGVILEQEELTVVPPYNFKYDAPTINGYDVIGYDRVDMEIKPTDKSPVIVVFNYMIQDKQVEIICRDEDTNEIIETSVRFYAPPTTDTINAPNISEYTLTSDESQDVEIDLDSPIIQQVTFFYKKDEAPEVEHAYDYKIVMRWQSNVSTDMDLHVFFNSDSNKHLYYGQKTIEKDENNKAWYDFDFMKHSGDNDYVTKPEISTILGQPFRTANVKVKAFARFDKLTDDVVVEVIKINSSGNEEIVKEYRVTVDDLNKTHCYYVCDIDLETDSVTRVERVIDKITHF